MAFKVLTIAVLIVLIVLSAVVPAAEGKFKSARYRRNMAFHDDGEDERVIHLKVHKRQKDIIEDPNPPLFPVVKTSRSYHYRYGPLYPTHHAHLKNTHFPLPKDQLLHP